MLSINFCEIFSQSDTIIYFSNLGRCIANKKNASYSITIIKESDNSFFQLEEGCNDNFEYLKEPVDISRINDSTYSVQTEDPKYPFIRIFSKNDTGYMIKEIRNNKISIGFSKLIFPLIKSGTWYTFIDSFKFKIAEEYYVDNEMTGNKNWNNDGSQYISDVFYVTETPIDYDNGNIDKLSGILFEYLKYPEDAREKGISGTVYVQCVVMEDGTIDGVRILRGLCESIDNEVIRVIKKIPDKWNPGIIRGKAVRAFTVLPVKFTLR